MTWTHTANIGRDTWILTDNGVVITQTWIRDGVTMSVRAVLSPVDKSPAPLVRLESDRQFEGL